MSHNIRPIKKLLVANRGEIAIRILRAASELNIKTVAIYTHEDRFSIHRYKADEAYQIGLDDEPLKPYLDIERIIKIAKANDVDGIHPGYGFLSENVAFAKRCEEENIIFVGPRPEVMQQLGDKIAAKSLARSIDIPVIQDFVINENNVSDLLEKAQDIGLPIILKAAAGGGGRGMRVIKEIDQLIPMYNEASNEALKAFGDGTIFIEKYIEQPKHIEVQLLADNFGNIVHLFERDCSVQRRFQKVVEVAPAVSLPQDTKDEVYKYAIRIAQEVNYNNAGTVEFLVDKYNKVYFIEVNPRIQVEHTVTEEITGIDIVRSQILIAQDFKLSDEQINISSQNELSINGFAIQCRITTEDPENDFKPDYGTLIAYRNAAGFGIRLDEGSAYQGMKISPFFDSMIVKVTASGKTLASTAQRLSRALSEFRVRGVTTNIRFLEQVINHDTFKKGECNVNFIAEHPELFNFRKLKDSSTKILKYLAKVSVNGHPDIKTWDPNKVFRKGIVPDFDSNQPYPKSYKNYLLENGRDGLIQHIKNSDKILFTDTTFRDAHQSLIATRVRTKDLLNTAESMARNNSGMFSMEVWGGATFDVAMRFLHECPWERLKKLRRKMPNLLLQMLFRGSNAVGYSTYPKNVIESFIQEAADNGIDIFRIFDSLNNIDSMIPVIQYIDKHTSSIAQGSICYTGDLLNTQPSKYDLNYYVTLAKKLEDAGAHMIAIKDMAGLLKPNAAEILIPALKKEINIPIALHTHDTAGTQLATYLKAIDCGVDSIDCAIASFSGTTSQPNMNSIVALLNNHKRENKDMDLKALNEQSNYWEAVRELYYPFESDLKSSTAEVYENEIPGGQYSNLRQQAEGVGLGDQLPLIKKNYAVVNKLFGDIVKVTPSSKVVGDMALFMTANGLTQEDVLQEDNNLAFPSSVIGFLKGDLGIPYGGFPDSILKSVLKTSEKQQASQSQLLADIDIENAFKKFEADFPKSNFLDFLSYQMFPKVFEEFSTHLKEYGHVEELPTSAFFYPLKINEEIQVKISKGKIIHVKLIFISQPDDEGIVDVIFELNGNQRTVRVKDQKISSKKVPHKKVSQPESQIGAPLQGSLSNILVKVGDSVSKGDPLCIIEAMKMETTISAPKSGTIAHIELAKGTLVDQNDLIIEIA